MKHYKIILALLLALALPSCDGDEAPARASGTVDLATASSTAFTTELAKLMTDMGTNLLSPTSVANVPGVSASSIAPFAADPEAACSTVTPSSLVDADGDDIAEEKHYVYDCTGLVHASQTYNKIGTVDIEDLDDSVTTADGGGYSYTYDMQYEIVPTHDFQYKGFYKLENSGNKKIHTSKYTGSFVEDNAGNEFAGTSSSNYVNEITTEDPADFWARGTVVGNGFYRIVVRGDIGGGTPNIVDWDFTFTFETDLVYERQSINGCTYFYRDGYMQFTDEGGNVMRFEFACNAYTYKVNGQIVTPI